MWGACTPESFAAKATDMNQGMHKRDAGHQHLMIRRAIELAKRHVGVSSDLV
jgi:hypothetical protein